jgi:hypothetical protein
MSKPPDDQVDKRAQAKQEPQAKQKLRKRKRKAQDDAIVLDANGRERPSFLLAFPEHPELAQLSRAFETGDYAYVREHAPDVARRADDDDVRRAALELAERIKPDPLIKYLLLLSLGLLLYLVIHAYTSHTP